MNLVYETEERMQILDQIKELVSFHGFIENCRCKHCREAEEIGQRIKHSPRVARILSKGENITTSEIQYLLSREVSVEEIAEATGLRISDILDVPFAGTRILRPRHKQSSTIPVTLEEHQEMKALGMTNSQIARKYGVTQNTYNVWIKKLNAMENGVEIPRLTSEKYMQLKSQGKLDKHIREQYKVSSDIFTIWKQQNISEEDLEKINSMTKRRNAKGTKK